MPNHTGAWRRLATRTRALPPMVVDAVIAGACLLMTVVVFLTYDHVRWWFLALAAGTAAPLLWRRRYPVLVTAATGVCTTWLSLVNALELPAGQLVATYTFAALSPPLLRMIAAAGTATGITISIIVPHSTLFPIGPVAIMFVVAYALGTSARARRDRIAMLEERTRRLAEEQDAAAARERERIARDMHDILAHSMSLVVVQAEAGPVAVRNDPGKAEETFRVISTTARDALTQLRRALGVLRTDEPARAPQPDLDLLPSLISNVRGAGLAANLTERGQPRPLPPERAAAVYRIAQEALTNTVRHAAATAVTVRLQWRDSDLLLTICDDGRGTAGDGDPGTGHGLVGMRERATAAGGELTAGAGAGGVGFQVQATIPVQ